MARVISPEEQLLEARKIVNEAASIHCKLVTQYEEMFANKSKFNKAKVDTDSITDIKQLLTLLTGYREGIVEMRRQIDDETYASIRSIARDLGIPLNENRA